MKNEVWTEKYRPKKISEIVGIDQKLFNTYISEPNKMPHLLLESRKPGTGKSSIGKVLINELKADNLFINASDDRKIEVIRDKIKRFAQTLSPYNAIKIVFLDECDGMLKASQEALRTIMDIYPTKFIITCNDINDIIEPIQSRCKGGIIHLQFPKREEIEEKLKYICHKEGVTISPPALKLIIEDNYPSIRDMINGLNRLYLQGNKNITEELVKGLRIAYAELYTMIREHKLLEARKIWVENGYPLKDVLKYFFTLYMKDPQGDVEEILGLFSESSYRMAAYADNDIVLTNFCDKLISLLKEE